jgi:DNA (cytosine-5)-methyltransferase 1
VTTSNEEPLNYYNEWDPFAAAWLRNLIAAGLLPDGDVDERSIADVQPADLEGYTQVHLFAGIGGWPLALQLAGWPSDAPVWTGSCPCQPFSNAGRGGGTSDPRHLWPQFHRLIAECRPPVVFGEQVASLDGRGWLAGVRADLESVGYAVGAADLCAASVGAPHIRSRLWWVADSMHDYWGGGERRTQTAIGEKRVGRWGSSSGSAGSGMADAGLVERERWDAIRGAGATTPRSAGTGAATAGGRDLDAGIRQVDGPPDGSAGSGFWDDAEFIPCLDGKSRRVEPGTPPLVDGFPGRVGQLRAYGNAISPQVAAGFVKAYLMGRYHGICENTL